jgi:hypothetical protein
LLDAGADINIGANSVYMIDPWMPECPVVVTKPQKPKEYDDIFAKPKQSYFLPPLPEGELNHKIPHYRPIHKVTNHSSME